MKKRIILLIILLSIFMIGAVSATATNTTDKVSTKLTDKTSNKEIIKKDTTIKKDVVSKSKKDKLSITYTGTFDDLEREINNTKNGGTLNLQKNYKANVSDTTLGIPINKSITINGNGHTLNGNKKRGILYHVYGDGFNPKINLILKNIQFINAESGAIYTYSDDDTVTIINCTFTNNKADFNGGAINTNGKLTITNSKFINNGASFGGGAISTYNLVMTNCTFTNNKADYNGGAISGHDMTIRNCNFTNNMLYGGGLGSSGGAIYSYGFINMIKCRFNQNVAVNGSAIYSEGKGIINNSYFAPDTVDTIWGKNLTIIKQKGQQLLIPTNLSGESVIFDVKDPKIFTTKLKDRYNEGVSGQSVRIELIKYSGESATFNGISNIKGVTAYNLGKLDAGMWYVNGIYMGSQDYMASMFKDKFVVIRMATKTAIEKIEDPEINKAYNIKADIHDEHGKIVKEGTVQFYLDGKNIGDIDLSNNLNAHKNNIKDDILGATNPLLEYKLGKNGKLYIKYIPKKLGKHTLTAVYEGTSIYGKSKSTTQFIVKKPSQIIAQSKIYKITMKTKKYSITLKSGKKQITPAKVTLKIGKKTYSAQTNKKGVATFKITNLNKKGTYTATITYNGDKNYNKAAQKVKITVNKENTKLTAQAKTFKESIKIKKYSITLKDSINQPIKTVPVTLNVNGKNYKANTNSKGIATFPIKNLNKKGTYTATITYNGDKNYNKVSKKVKLTIK